MRIITGNILDIKSGIIVHQVNCQNAMGAGIANQIARKWPIVKTAYHEYCAKHDEQSRFGICQPVRIDDGLIVVNLFSQFFYGDTTKTGICYTDYQALFNGIGRICNKYPGAKIYVPYGIGCGLAGGDWTVVFEQLKQFDITLVRRPADIYKDPTISNMKKAVVWSMHKWREAQKKAGVANHNATMMLAEYLAMQNIAHQDKPVIEYDLELTLVKLTELWDHEGLQNMAMASFLAMGLELCGYQMPSFDPKL